jgi:hypothetical protein
MLFLGALQTAAVGGEAAFDVRRFGAVADGTTLNTVAIQKAIDACHAAGGGRVVVAGGVYLSGAVQLRSRVTLVVEAGTTLLGSPNIADYRVKTEPIDWGWTYKKTAIAFAPCLIYAERAEHVGLEGKGTVDGQGGRQRKVFPNRGDADQRRPILVRFHECRDVTLRDVTLLDPAAYATFFVHSRDIAIAGVTIRSRQTPNGDGLDLDGCRNVRIADCDLDCGDDAISPKTSHPDWPNEDFTITGCRMKSEWAAIRLGAESIAPMRRLDMRDCVFDDCRDGIKIESSEGALYEDLSFRGIQMRDVNRPFYITATRFNFSAHARSSRLPAGRMRGLRFSDITAVARASDPTKPFDRTCSAIVSLPCATIEDVVFSNVDLTFPGGGTAEQARRIDVAEMLHFNDYKQWARPFDGELPCSVLYLRHLRDVRLENVRLRVAAADERPYIAGDDIDGLTLAGVVGHGPAPAPGLAKLLETRRVSTRDCRVENAAGAPLLVTPTAEDLRRLADLRARSAALDNSIQRLADAADVAEHATPLLVLPAQWNFRPDPDDAGEWARWFAAAPDGAWKPIRVDQPWSKQGFAEYRGVAWYAVQFETPDSDLGSRVLLRFGAINGRCRAWLDGEPVVERMIDPIYVWKFPWVVDLTTTRLRTRTTHRLVVRVESTAPDPGVNQPAELLRLP